MILELSVDAKNLIVFIRCSNLELLSSLKKNQFRRTRKKSKEFFFEKLETMTHGHPDEKNKSINMAILRISYNNKETLKASLIRIFYVF